MSDNLADRLRICEAALAGQSATNAELLRRLAASDAALEKAQTAEANAAAVRVAADGYLERMNTTSHNGLQAGARRDLVLALESDAGAALLAELEAARAVVEQATYDELAELRMRLDDVMRAGDMEHARNVALLERCERAEADRRLLYHALDEIDHCSVGGCESLTGDIEPCDACGEMRTIAENVLDAYKAASDRRAPRPTVVCLCGSTRFWREFQRAGLAETMAGRIVLSIGAASGTDDEHFGNLPREEYDRVKAMLDELHLRKIDMADEVLILNVGGYIGPSTRRELEYAERTGKRVRYLEGQRAASASAVPGAGLVTGAEEGGILDTEGGSNR